MCVYDTTYGHAVSLKTGGRRKAVNQEAGSEKAGFPLAKADVDPHFYGIKKGDSPENIRYTFIKSNEGCWCFETVTNQRLQRMEEFDEPLSVHPSIHPHLSRDQSGSVRSF